VALVWTLAPVLYGAVTVISLPWIVVTVLLLGIADWRRRGRIANRLLGITRSRNAILVLAIRADWRLRCACEITDFAILWWRRAVSSGAGLRTFRLTRLTLSWGRRGWTGVGDLAGLRRHRICVAIIRALLTVEFCATAGQCQNNASCDNS
jgi:hypothetical protein